MIKIPLRGLDLQAVRYYTGEPVSEVMLYPALTKNREDSPFSYLINCFRERLRSSELCVCIGYSFRDNWMKNALIDAMIENPYLWLLLVSPNATLRKKEMFAKREEIGYRVVSLDSGTKEALVDRTLYHTYSTLTKARSEEQQAMDTEAKSGAGGGIYLRDCLQQYKEIHHDDRIRLLVEEFWNEFPVAESDGSIERIVFDLSTRYALDYLNLNLPENAVNWLRILVNMSGALENSVLQSASRQCMRANKSKLSLDAIPAEKLDQWAQQFQFQYSPQQFFEEFEDDIDCCLGSTNDETVRNTLESLKSAIHFLGGEDDGAKVVSRIAPSYEEIAKRYSQDGFGLYKSASKLLELCEKRII